MNLQQLADGLVDLTKLAGIAITEVYDADNSPAIRYKSDHSPVTEADERAHQIIVDGLTELTPQIPILSEEQEIPSYYQRSSWRQYWLVDPLDGTREFIDRTGEFTVNIALIDMGIPVLGVVYVPLENQAYWGAIDCGAWKVGPKGKKQIRTSGVPNETVRVLTSSRHHNRELQDCIDKFRHQFKGLEQLKAGSALKFCRLSEGKGDIYPRFSPCCEWDTAAGHAVLNAAGGELITTDLMPFRYNLKDSLINPHFYALGGRAKDWLPLLK